MFALTLFRWLAARHADRRYVPAQWNRLALAPGGARLPLSSPALPKPEAPGCRRARALARLDARSDVFGRRLRWETVLEQDLPADTVYLSVTEAKGWKLYTLLEADGCVAKISQMAVEHDAAPSFVRDAVNTAEVVRMDGADTGSAAEWSGPEAGEPVRDGDVAAGTASLLQRTLNDRSDRELREALVESARLDVLELTREV